MMIESLSPRRGKRLAELGLKLHAFLDRLDLPKEERRKLLPKAILGPGRRLLTETQALLPETTLYIPGDRAIASDLFVAIIACLKTLGALLHAAEHHAHADNFPRNYEVRWSKFLGSSAD